jgi:hypothetical protein
VESPAGYRAGFFHARSPLAGAQRRLQDAPYFAANPVIFPVIFPVPACYFWQVFQILETSSMSYRFRAHHAAPIYRDLQGHAVWTSMWALDAWDTAISAGRSRRPISWLGRNNGGACPVLRQDFSGREVLEA